MASKFSIQSKSYDGRYLKLDLAQTKNVSDNTSTVKWTLTTVAGDDPYYSTGPTTAKLGDKQLCYYPRKSYSTHEFPTGPENASVSGTVTVAHNADGTLTLPVSLTTAIYTSTTSTVSGNWTLDAIPRGSSIAEAGDVTLGNSCSVRWTPNSASFRYKLRFSLGEWSYTTGAIHPNKTSSYVYTEYTIPIDVAEQITADNHGTMTVELITYTDSACANSVGSDSETFTVTVPENSSTQPVVDMTLTPAETPFPGLYLQGQTKVQAAFTAEGKLGAGIQKYTMTADGRSYESPYLSNYLTTSGELEITGTAIDSRGIPGTVKQTVTVLPYYRPRLTGVAAYRCTADGVYAENGEYLKIEATCDFAPVIAEGVQKNFCAIQYRYKAEIAEDYSDYVTILGGDTDQNTVITEPLLNATLYKSVAYAIQISAIDTVGQETTAMVLIPSERVFRHKRPGGRGLGLGGYCEEDDLLDVHWNQRIRKDLRVDGSVSGVYIRTVQLEGADAFTLQSQFNAEGKQVVMLFGIGTGEPVNGVASLQDNGGASWSGTGAVTITAGTEGMFVFTLPEKSDTTFVLMAAHSISIVQEV